MGRKLDDIPPTSEPDQAAALKKLQEQVNSRLRIIERRLRALENASGSQTN